ncbi:MAG: asparaginase domain-containing protein, partial [Syntrophobacteraceae bacterium]
MKPKSRDYSRIGIIFLFIIGTVFFPLLARAELPVVSLIATGGTIAMKIDPVKNAPVPAISGDDLLATVPEIAKIARIEVQN